MLNQYSFISEATTIVVPEDASWWENAKALFRTFRNSNKDAKQIKDAASDEFLKNHPKIAKTIKPAKIIGTSGAAAYTTYLAIMNGLMAKKLTVLIKELQKPQIDTRIKAASLFINLGYIKDDLIDLGDGVRSISVNYEVSSKIAGPVIQIIKNPNDPDWKNHAISYLKKQRMYMIAKSSVIYPASAGASLYGLHKIIKGK